MSDFIIYQLGKIAYINKGDYNPNTVYSEFQVVLYNNGSYVYYNQESASGKLPTNTDYWKVMLDPSAMNAATQEAQTVADALAEGPQVIQDAKDATAEAVTATQDIRDLSFDSTQVMGAAQDALQTALSSAAISLKSTFIFMGTYNTQTIYKKHNFATFDGSSYLYINDQPSAGMPLNDPEYWNLMAAKGKGTGVDGLIVIDGKLYLAQNGEIISNGVSLPSGGGGGGTGGGSTAINLVNLMQGTILNVAKGAPMVVSFNYTSTDDPSKGTARIYVDEVVKATVPLNQGSNDLDVTAYLKEGGNAVRIYCYDMFSNSKSITYTINAIDLKITSTFDDSMAYSGNISFKYIPYGAIDKVIYFKIDGTEVATSNVSTTGKQVTQILPVMTHGAHTLEIYSTAVIEGETITSPILHYDVVAIVSGETQPIITSSFIPVGVLQGQLIEIPFLVYDPIFTTVEAELTISKDGVAYKTKTITVDRTKQFWNTRDYPDGQVSFTISYGGVSKTHVISIETSQLSVSAVTDGLLLHLDSGGRSNNESNPEIWENSGIITTFQDFNWVDNGWIPDEHGDVALRLSGKAKIEIGIKPFFGEAKISGKTIELEYAIRNVNNREAVAVSCVSNGIGLEVTADQAMFLSEQSKIAAQYKDETKNRISFVVGTSADDRLLSTYLNGVISGVVQYPASDNFEQTPVVNITAGSDLCTIDIYRIRIYDAALTTDQIRDNFVADTADVMLRSSRFADNNSLYDEFGRLSFSKIKDIIPTMVITGSLPVSKGDKKTVRVEYTDPRNPSLNFDDTGTIDVQGTSSQFYVRKNWKIKFKQMHQHAPDRLPSNVFCMKADYAEATGTHNTQNANYVEELYPSKTPPQQLYEGVRTTIYGFPCVIYHRENTNDVPSFHGKYNFNYDKGSLSVFGFTSEFPNAECWEFANNTSENCLFKGVIDESMTVNDKGEAMYVWQNNFEGRQPDGYTDISRFKIMHSWVVSTARELATDDLLSIPYVDIDNVTHTQDTADYRLAKFKTEFNDHFKMDFSLLYYVYTLTMLMTDQRAKNMFLTTWDGVKWEPWFYDNDTCLGINNEGQLVFDYYHEDIDYLEGAEIFNGQSSTLWNNFKDAFPVEIRQFYQSLRGSKKLSYDNIIEHFITNGSDKWTESIYNEDAEFKYVSPLRDNNDASNLYQVRGTGEEHLKYFVSNRLKYLDGKWYAPEYAEDNIYLRVYTPAMGTWFSVEPNANITLTPFSNMYGGVRYKANATIISHRIDRNIPHTFVAPVEVYNDTETSIYGASQISSLGDLAPLYCGQINVSKATRLKELIVGSPDPAYINNNLTVLSVGTNKLLTKIDVRGCVNLTAPLALSGCPSIEEIQAERTKITGVELSETGYVKILRMPNTVTNITVLNQNSIEDFYCAGYSKLTTLRVENSIGIPVEEILASAFNLVRLRLLEVNLTYPDKSILTRLATLGGLDEKGNNIPQSVLTGTIHINATDYQTQVEAYQQLWPLLTVVFDEVIPVHTVTFKDWDNRLIGVQRVIDGENAVLPEATVKAEDNDFRYDFAGWSLDTTNVHEDMVVNAVFDAIPIYTVVFENWDNTVLKTQIVAIGQSATAPQTPTKEADESFVYTFKNWSSSFENVQSHLTVTATYTATPFYTVIFKDWDETTLKTEKVSQGGNATAPASPSRETDDSFVYAFSGWSSSLTNIQENITINAVYSTTPRYVVTFRNWDDAVLKTEIVTQGLSATAPANPERPRVGNTGYTFNAWNPAFNNVQGNLEVYATYTTISYYIVTFKNWDGSVLKTEEVVKNGNATPPVATRPNSGGYKYTFDSWSGSYTNVQSDLILTASYTQTVAPPPLVRFLNNDGSVLHSYTLANGVTTAVYPSSSSNVPTKTNGAGEDWIFHDWLPRLSEPVYDTTDFIPEFKDWNNPSDYATITNIPPYLFQGDTTITFTSLPPNITSIGAEAFRNCTNITLTSLPSGLTSIGNYAFRDCTKLALTSLPSDITSMGTYAFRGCSNITLTSLPSGLTSIGTYAFSGCTNLALTSLPDGITSIGNGAFDSCNALTSITFEGTPTSIDSGAFISTTNLTTINVPWANGAVANAPWGATNATINYDFVPPPSTVRFLNHDGTVLKSYTVQGNAYAEYAITSQAGIPVKASGAGEDVKFNDFLPRPSSTPIKKATDFVAEFKDWNNPSEYAEITNIPPYLFYNNTTITFTSLPPNVTSIGSSAFRSCTNLALTSLPDGITSISEYTFYGCTKLALTSLPNVTSIGVSAFDSCSKLALISLPDGITSIGNYAFRSCGELALTSLPDDITSIGTYAFYYCPKLALTSLPDGLTSIGSNVFGSCTNLALTTLPDGITNIDYNAFYNCTKLALTSLPSEVTSIGVSAFDSCSALTSITFEGTPTSIASNAFLSTTNLTTINVPWSIDAVANAPWGATNATINYDYIPPPSTVRFLNHDGTVLKSYTVQGNAYAEYEITSQSGIPVKASGAGEDVKFNDWLPRVSETPIKKATDFIAEFKDWNNPAEYAEITNIPPYLFQGDTTITFTSLPPNITSIGAEAFRNCTNITLTSLPSGLTSIGNYAFRDCTKLALTSLPSDITSMGTYAFRGCSNITLTSLPSGLTSIGTYAFSGCTNLALTSLPDGITSIGAEAFRNCTNITLTSLPSGLISIGSNTFYSCGKLALTSLPDGLTNIDGNAFSGCSGLTSITFEGTPTSIASNAFSSTTNLVTINVPWSNGAVANAPWGATNATINYNYVP